MPDPLASTELVAQCQNAGTTQLQSPWGRQTKTGQTLYATDFGSSDGASHVIVADYDNYVSLTTLDAKRAESHGWANFLLTVPGIDAVSSDLVTVVDGFGKPRHEAGYLVVYAMSIKDIDSYRAALSQLNDELGNPGVLRLAAKRSGDPRVNYFVILGADDFAAAMKFTDKMVVSEAYKTFSVAVAENRTVVNVSTYRKVGAWGY